MRLLLWAISQVKQRCVLRQFIAINDNQTCKSWGFYMKWIQVNHDGEEGKKEGEPDWERERDLGREGEQLSREKMAWLILTVCLNQTTPANSQHLRFSWRGQSITTTEGLDINQALEGIQHSSAKLAQQHLLE